MNGLIAQHFAVFFPVFFGSLWLAVTVLLALLSGWFRLMVAFPDRDEEPLLQLHHQSGSMGLGVNMGGILRLSVCSSGLRIGIMRIFGPFNRDFLVPWESIAVTRKTILFWPVCKLSFGNPAIGRLSISAMLANRLARAAGARWPETGLALEDERSGAAWRRLLGQWVLLTGTAALFFNLAPLMFGPSGARPPILMTVLFPAVVFGVFTIIQFMRERH